MHERLRELCAKEKEMRRSGTLQREASSLFGADLVFKYVCQGRCGGRSLVHGRRKDFFQGGPTGDFS